MMRRGGGGESKSPRQIQLGLWYRVSLVCASETAALCLPSLSSEIIYPYKYYNIKLTQAQHSNISRLILSLLLPPTLPSLNPAIGADHLCVPPSFQSATRARD